MSSLIIEQRRGLAVEGSHEVDAIAVDQDGRVLWQVGTDALTTFRSAAKPFQLEVSSEALSAEQREGLTAADLAIGAASHHGEPAHVQQVLDLLRKLVRDPSHLRCGAHAPSHAPSAQALWASGGTPSVLHNNCSGKHSFMAAACVAQGLSPEYLDPNHPLQRAVLARVQQRSGGSVRGVVVDGCGLPCFVLPLTGMARAWANLAAAMAEGNSLLGRIGNAMRAHPHLMSGSGAFDGFLTAQTSALAKVGAQGLLCVALPEQRAGVTIKLRSGVDVVRPVAGWAVLGEAFPGFIHGEPPECFTSVTNAAGATVGELVARWL